MDEVEIYNRALTDKEILSIYNAVSCGKCKITASLPAVTPFCTGQTTAVAYLTICNESTVPTTFTWEMNPEAPNSPDCNVTGPGIFSPPSGATTTPTMPGDCVSIPITITRPSGFSPGDVGCYQATVTANALQTSSICEGSIRAIYSWCDTIGSSNRLAQIAPPDSTLPDSSEVIAFDIRNDGASSTLDYTIQAMGDTTGVPGPISLDGLPPGTPIANSISIPPGGSAEVSVNVSFVRHTPFRIYDIAFLTDEDGDGYDEVISSAPVRSRLESDCNLNGVPDQIDISVGTSTDADGNGVPDECEQVEPPTSSCPSSIPMLSFLGFAVLILALGSLGAVMIHRRKKRAHA